MHLVHALSHQREATCFVLGIVDEGVERLHGVWPRGGKLFRPLCLIEAHPGGRTNPVSTGDDSVFHDLAPSEELHPPPFHVGLQEHDVLELVDRRTEWSPPSKFRKVAPRG